MIHYQRLSHTLGDSADWYLRLARRAGAGVFSDYPDLSTVPPAMTDAYRKLNTQRRMPPLNLLTRLGFILTDDDARSSPALALSRARWRDL